MTDEVWEQAEAARDAEALYNERVRTAAWLDQQNFPPLEWVVHGIVPEGMGLLVAPPKAGKSWWVNNIALACASGGMALGAIPVKQRPVLLLALEDGDSRLQSRFRTLMEGQALPDALEYIIRASPTEARSLMSEFLRRHRHNAPLVIVDTLGKVKPQKAYNEDSYQADYRIGGALKQLVDDVPGGCLLLVHHTRKAEAGDFVDSVSGTQGIAGSADFVLVLNRKRHADEAILSVTGRDVQEAEYALTTQDGRWRLDGADLGAAMGAAQVRSVTGNLGDDNAAAVAFVNGRPEGTKAADLATHLGIDPKTAGTYLGRLYKSGRIDKGSRGLYLPLLEVLKVLETNGDSNRYNTFNTPTPSGQDYW